MGNIYHLLLYNHIDFNFIIFSILLAQICDVRMIKSSWHSKTTDPIYNVRWFLYSTSRYASNTCIISLVLHY